MKWPSDTIVGDFHIPFHEYGLLSFTVKDVWMATSFSTTYYGGLKLPYNLVGAMYKLSYFRSFNFLFTSCKWPHYSIDSSHTVNIYCSSRSERMIFIFTRSLCIWEAFESRCGFEFRFIQRMNAEDSLMLHDQLGTYLFHFETHPLLASESWG